MSLSQADRQTDSQLVLKSVSGSDRQTDRQAVTINFKVNINP